MSSWTCNSCTFLNPSSQISSCQVCLSASPSLSSTPSLSQWACKSCTFINPLTRSDCEMCGSRASNLALSSTIKVDDDDSSVGSVFFPLRACNKRKTLDSPIKIVDDGEGSGGFRGPKSSKKAVLLSDDDCDEKSKFKGVKSVTKSALSSDDDRDEKIKFSGVKSATNSAHSSDDNNTKTKSKTLKVLSYNVWFREDLEMRNRMRAIGNLIQLHSPDFICLQEVTPDIYDTLRQSTWWSGYYCSVTTDMAITRGYFCMQLSKLEVKSFSCKAFNNSIMGRELCIANLEVQEGLPLVIATTHLESPCPAPPTWNQMFSKERVEQANKAIDILKQEPNVIFCGDMNWCDKLDGQFPLPDGWVDAWVSLKPGDNGWTYDTKSNKMLTGQKSLQKRLDRFLCNLRDFEIKSIEMIGTEAIPGLSHIKEKKVKGEVRKLELPVLPSDHYGLLLTLGTC